MHQKNKFISQFSHSFPFLEGCLCLESSLNMIFDILFKSMFQIKGFLQNFEYIQAEIKINFMSSNPTQPKECRIYRILSLCYKCNIGSTQSSPSVKVERSVWLIATKRAYAESGSSYSRISTKIDPFGLVANKPGGKRQILASSLDFNALICKLLSLLSQFLTPPSLFFSSRPQHCLLHFLSFAIPS